VTNLSPEQYRVTQLNGIERPFDNAYWDNKEPGTYVGVVSGEPLFASVDKFDSGCGWPSSTRPLEPENVLENTDNTQGMIRTELQSGWAPLLREFGVTPFHYPFCRPGVCGTVRAMRSNRKDSRSGQVSPAQT
jgi:SelR domain